MGSLNYDGTTKNKQNVTYRNIGNAISATSGSIPNAESVLVVDNSGLAPLRGTDVDTLNNQNVTTSTSTFIKTVSSNSGELISRDTGYTPSASGSPQHAYVLWHTGDRIVEEDSSSDEIVERKANTSVRPPNTGE